MIAFYVQAGHHRRDRHAAGRRKHRGYPHERRRCRANRGKNFFRPHNKDSKLQSHRLYHGTVRDPKSARAVDEVLLAIMRRPKSYTGEDVVEIHCHGGAFIVRRVLQLVLSEGARQAEPGSLPNALS
jgi:hypothetical protein